MQTTTRGINTPDDTDPRSLGAQRIRDVAQFSNDNPGIAQMTTVARDAMSGAAKLYDGRVIYNTTTLQHEKYIGGVWTALVAPATVFYHQFMTMGT